MNNEDIKKEAVERFRSGMNWIPQRIMTGQLKLMFSKEYAKNV